MPLTGEATRSKAASATRRDDIDPLQLSVASVATRQVPRDKTNDSSVLQRDVSDARRQRILRMEFTVHVTRNANPPILFLFPIIGADMRHCRDVEFVGKSVKHSVHGNGGLSECVHVVKADRPSSRKSETSSRSPALFVA